MQANRNSITLKGSVDIVTEFFDYGINSILYQRGIYAPEQFQRVQKYGLTMLVTSDDALKSYLRGVLGQVRGLFVVELLQINQSPHLRSGLLPLRPSVDWLMQKTVQKLVVVISENATNEVLERWQFDVECDKSATHSR